MARRCTSLLPPAAGTIAAGGGRWQSEAVRSSQNEYMLARGLERIPPLVLQEEPAYHSDGVHPPTAFLPDDRSLH
jgi:hypothetical protein